LQLIRTFYLTLRIFTSYSGLRSKHPAQAASTRLKSRAITESPANSGSGRGVISPSHRPRRGEVNGAIVGLPRNVVGNTQPLWRLGDDGAYLAENVMLKDPSKDEVLRQMNTTPVNLPAPDPKRWVGGARP
jgi:hypothetical protein